MKYLKLAVFIIVMFVFGRIMESIRDFLTFDTGILYDYISLILVIGFVVCLMYLIKRIKIFEYKKLTKVEYKYTALVALIVVMLGLLRTLINYGFSSADITFGYGFFDSVELFFKTFDARVYETIIYVVLPVGLFLDLFEFDEQETVLLGLLIPVMMVAPMVVSIKGIHFIQLATFFFSVTIPLMLESYIYIKYKNLATSMMLVVFTSVFFVIKVSLVDPLLF